MVTFRKLLNRALVTSLVMISSPAVTPVAFAALPASINLAEVQRFEQSYELWVQTLTQTIAPSIPVTVIVDLDYTASEEKLQDYEDAQEVNHLPGLPEVTDTSYAYPIENPLYSLVSQKKVKLIFEGSLTETQKKILNEVLVSKLKINTASGDRLTMENMDSALAAQTQGSRKKEAAAIGLAVLMIAAIGAARRKKAQPTATQPASTQTQAVANSESTSPTIQITLNNDQPIVEHITKINPALSWYTKNAVDPIQVILKADTKVLLAVMRNEKPQAVAQVIQGLSEGVAAMLLKLCSREQRNEIRNILTNETAKATAEQVKYQQLLLAARVHRQAKRFQELTTELDRFTQSQSAKEETLSNLEELKNKIMVEVAAEEPATPEEYYENENLSNQ